MSRKPPYPLFIFIFYTIKTLFIFFIFNTLLFIFFIFLTHYFFYIFNIRTLVFEETLTCYSIPFEVRTIPVHLHSYTSFGLKWNRYS